MKYSVILLIVIMAPVAARAIERACVRVGLTRKALAIDMRISESQLSRELSGDGHIALDRLDGLSAEFHQALLEELASAWGCEKPLTARDVLDLIRPVMARAGASAQQEESCA